MREELAKLHGKRRRFQGTFSRFGQKAGYKSLLTTILLLDVTDVSTGKVVTDHLWFTMGKHFQKVELKQGDLVRFDARVTEYEKGYRDRKVDFGTEIDYRLSFPTNMMKWQKLAGIKQNLLDAMNP